ncbi:hypothetical protein GPJ56_010391 [Histomonas meleagridis]|uniref:uncharacterized protein n=1 Tax=Histomonas meleagridis TaxID=135588 RepID=UPI0035596D13|nr:hypothetical protein GPJ56_010391 [Histomonas meleagridis]KAH0799051.1 hypothetical protein GO595_008203 [Histomonas meleagridis]
MPYSDKLNPIAFWNDKPNFTLSLAIDFNEEIPIISYDDNKSISVKSTFLVIRDKNLLLLNHTSNVIYTTFPDNGYLSLQGAIYSLTMPDYVLYVNSSNVKYMPSYSWIQTGLDLLHYNMSNVLFGGCTTFQGKKVGIGVALIKTTLVRELLYYTNSTLSSPPPLLVFSLLENKKFFVEYLPFEGMKESQNYDHITTIEKVRYEKCLITNKSSILSVFLPLFKRENIYEYIKKYEEQTIKPNLYLLFQCENRFTLDLELIRKNINYRVPIYHIWCYNWRPLFMFPTYVAGMLPTDIIMRYDDDQTPINNETHQIYINVLENEDAIIGWHFYEDTYRVFHGRNPQPCGKADHIASPTMFRPIHAKISARIKVLTFSHGEDIYLSISSKVFCRTNLYARDVGFEMNGFDGFNHENDEKMREAKGGKTALDLVNEIYDDFENHGYIPECYNAENVQKGNFTEMEHEHSEYMKYL